MTNRTVKGATRQSNNASFVETTAGAFVSNKDTKEVSHKLASVYLDD